MNYENRLHTMPGISIVEKKILEGALLDVMRFYIMSDRILIATIKDN